MCKAIRTSLMNKQFIKINKKLSQIVLKFNFDNYAIFSKTFWPFFGH